VLRGINALDANTDVVGPRRGLAMQNWQKCESAQASKADPAVAFPSPAMLIDAVVARNREM